MSKIPVPLHTSVCLYFSLFIETNTHLDTQTAMHDFVQTFVSQDDFTKSILPTMEKALLRSPEFSLNSESAISCDMGLY